MRLYRIWLFGLGVLFACLALKTTDSALTMWWPDRFPPYDDPYDCECDHIELYDLVNDLTGGCGVLVLLGMYGLSVRCFLKALCGQRD